MLYNIDLVKKPTKTERQKGIIPKNNTQSVYVIARSTKHAKSILKQIGALDGGYQRLDVCPLSDYTYLELVAKNVDVYCEFFTSTCEKDYYIKKLPIQDVIKERTEGGSIPLLIC